MTKDHFLVICYGNKWPLCVVVPFNILSSNHSFQWCRRTGWSTRDVTSPRARKRCLSRSCRSARHPLSLSPPRLVGGPSQKHTTWGSGSTMNYWITENVRYSIKSMTKGIFQKTRKMGSFLKQLRYHILHELRSCRPCLLGRSETNWDQNFEFSFFVSFSAKLRLGRV